jgi:uncharacterized membrane-anchored protein
MITQKQRGLAFIAVTALVICAFGFGIVEKEDIKQNGQLVLMELAPVDPRSLMQGDYMRLNYKAAQGIAGTEESRWQLQGTAREEADKKFERLAKRGYAVFAPDAANVAHFIRLYDDKTPLGKNEFVIRYHKEYWNIRLVPDSFMFQEGHRDIFQPARYGMFRVNDEGKVLLVGLADEHKQQLVEETTLKTE